LIVAFSTSSPLASVALISSSGSLLASAQREARHAAGGACLEMLTSLLAEAGRSLDEVETFAADLGPGSFTGVKVGVTLAKTLAFAMGAQAAGASSFDLIDPESRSAVPCRKGEYLVRDPGAEPRRVAGTPAGALGYGPEFENPRWPLAERFGALAGRLVRMAPEALVPEYVLEPNISTPKRPYGSPSG